MAVSITTRTSAKFARAVVTRLDIDVAVEDALEHFCHSPWPAVLESLGPAGDQPSVRPPHARFSILTCDPVDRFAMEEDTPGCPFAALARHASAYPQVDPPPYGLPFTGGWIGYFSYEAGLVTEAIGQERPLKKYGTESFPLALFHLYDHAAIYDHVDHRWYATAIDWPQGVCPRRGRADDRIARVKQLLEKPAPPKRNESSPSLNIEPFRCNMTYEEYGQNFSHIKCRIENGDVYQVNLTQRYSTRTTATPLEIYRRLRVANPSSHAAFLPWGDVAVICSSPELFLDLRGKDVITRPIKGTCRRSHDAERDEILKDELLSSEKDRAELTMIIDLLRNDLGRVCEYGSIQVVEEAAIETHPTVFHLVGTIKGRLAHDKDWSDLLVATMPGGSITGTPKIRAMQIIDRLEPTSRTVYCGSIGYVGLDGSMSLNIAIRTMVQRGTTLHLYAGGGIVADSRIDAEYDECIAKAEGMLRALGVDSAALAHSTLDRSRP